MSTVPRQRRTREIEYPTTDGKPMAETELHMEDMIDTIQTLQDHFADRPNVYIWGNLLLFYEEGNPRKHRLARRPGGVRGPQDAEARSLPGVEGREGPRLRDRDHVEDDQARGRDEEVRHLSRHSQGIRVFPVRPQGRLPQPAAPGLPADRGGLRLDRAGRGPPAERGAGPPPRARWAEAADLRPRGGPLVADAAGGPR